MSNFLLLTKHSKPSIFKIEVELDFFFVHKIVYFTFKLFKVLQHNN